MTDTRFINAAKAFALAHNIPLVEVDHINGHIYANYIEDDFHFPVFNLADICLTVGVFMIIIHLLFLDDNAVFRKSKKCEGLEGNNDAS